MIWPLDSSTPVQSIDCLEEPTLASQITVSQFQIPLTDILFQIIPFIGIIISESIANIPLYDARKIPMFFVNATPMQP
jgi:hypothetical protein